LGLFFESENKAGGGGQPLPEKIKWGSA